LISKPEKADYLQVIESCREKSKNIIPDIKEEWPTPKQVNCYLFDLPIKYYKYRFDAFHGHEKIVEGLKQYCKGPESIFLYGPTGCGKTHLACAAAHESNCKYGWFTTAPELLLKIRGTFANDSHTTEEEIIKTYTICDILLLDDLGAEKTSEFAITSLYLIIDRRNRNDKKTIITSNLSPQEISEKLDARIASRIADMKIINLSKLPDYRKRR